MYEPPKPASFSGPGRASEGMETVIGCGDYKLGPQENHHLFFKGAVLSAV